MKISEVVFRAGEFPQVNPRITKTGDYVSHIELFGDNQELDDGSVKAIVAEFEGDMKEEDVEKWVEAARKEIGAVVLKYYTVDIIAAIGSVLDSDERYDAIKEALIANRINHTPIWDMFSTGMYIPAGDPRLDIVKEALVSAGLLTEDEFNRILEAAK